MYLLFCLSLSLSLSLSLFFQGSAEGSDTISTTENSGTNRSVLFTTQSILRDVGASISVVSALFFPSFAVPCLRIHIFPLCFMCLSSLYPFSLLSRSDVIASHYCKKCQRFFHDIVPYNIRKNLLFLLLSLCRNDNIFIRYNIDVDDINKKAAWDKKIFKRNLIFFKNIESSDNLYNLRIQFVHFPKQDNP